MVTADRLAAARAAAGAVRDPELPMLTIAELGILRDVAVIDGRTVVTVTPTFSGCPAMAEIRADLRRRLDAAGCADVEVRTSLAPAWTTAWITPAGRRKLAAAGIAPPTGRQRHVVPLGIPHVVPCPQCGSLRTAVTAEFGSTACRSLHRCRECGEPFEHVKDV